MRIRALAIALTFAVAPATAAAQGMEHGHQDVGINSIKPLYEQFRGWIVASAEQMPEENYGFQPTPEVRTFGQLIGHVANAGYLFCSGAMGEERPSMPNAEEMTSKAKLVEAIKASFAYCDKAYAMSEAKAMEQTTFFGRDGSRLWVLNFNATHNAEHYGNLVTYMRMKEMVPTSSQRGEM
jgi:uncharacterized damage-inducible protein DinB